MKITQLYFYPIKSLRGISVPIATLCPQGLAYDRRYILLKLLPDGTYRNMFVGYQTEMALFHCALSSSTSFTVSYHTPSSPVTAETTSQKTTIEIPFEPDTAKLQTVKIELHTKLDFPALRMPDPVNKWFSECFGYEVVLAYIGDGKGIQKQDEIAQSWLSSIEPLIPGQLDAVQFSDGAALLVASEASLEALNPRLEGEKAILEKFRPNLVVDGTEPWVEDFWGELRVTRLGTKIILTSNCARCISINIDLEKGRMAEGESGKLLKKMMKDRRVDKGNKWTPIFGRYGFPAARGEIQVGDEVTVSRKNTEHTIWNGVMPRLTSFGQPTVTL